MAKKPKKKKDSGFDALIRGLAQDLRDRDADEIEFDGEKYSRDELVKLRDVNAAIEERSNKTGKKASKELKTLNKEREALLVTCPGLRFVTLDDLNKALVIPVKSTAATAVANQVASGPDQSASPPVQMDAAQDKTSTTNVQTKNASTIVESYKQRYSYAVTGKYMPGCKEPKIEKENVKLTFPSSVQANTFYQDQALQRPGEGFVVFDKNKKVMAYSNGDGSLYKADGKPYASGEDLVSSNMTLEDLKRKAIEDSKLAAAASAELKNASSSKEGSVTTEATAAAEEWRAQLATGEAAAPEGLNNTSSSKGASVTTEATTAEEKQLNLDKILQKRMAESKQSNGSTDVEIKQKTNVLNELKSFNRNFLKPLGATTNLTPMTPDDSTKKTMGNG